MESVHGYFGQFQNTEAQIDRSIDDYFWFLLSNRYEIVANNVPVECGGSSYEFFARVGLVTSRGPLFYGGIPNTILLRFL